MTFLSQTAAGISWLNRFSEPERDTAGQLIDQILLVSRDDFANGLRGLLDDIAGQRRHLPGKMALYAERPVKKVYGRIPAFFADSRHGRASGTGTQPIVVDPRDQEVGSEGIIAQLITDYCRRNPANALNHPGPTRMRQDKVKKIVLLTDFIGSGDRITGMLESLRYVATLRSWRSYGLIRFIVLAYSGLTEGVSITRSHKLRPDVHLVAGCPTIANTFRGKQRSKIEALCRAHPSRHPQPLGYGTRSWVYPSDEGGALIAFAHGCPNNVPAILYSRASGWVPLFEGRSTPDAPDAFLPEGHEVALDQRAQNLLRIRDAQKSLLSVENEGWISAMLVLAAADEGLRTIADISGRTHLSIARVTKLVALAKNARWLTETGRLTRLGRYERERLRRRRRRTPVLPGERNTFYYPTQLRAP